MSENTSPFYREPEFETIQLHGGQIPDPTTNARAVPIYASTSFVFNDSAHGADLFGLRAAGNIYSRIGNPTVTVFEDRIAQLEGGIAAVGLSSGHSAQFLTISALAKPGDNIVSTTFLYGGSYNQFKVTFKHYNININWVTDTNPSSFEKAIDENTKAIFIESIANPGYVVLDIEEIAKIAHKHGIPLIVDNTFGIGGYLISPIKLGADIIVHSTTKWIGGHGTTIGGVIIDSGNFPWSKYPSKFPTITGPADGYHGLIPSDTFGRAAFAVVIRTQFLRDIGACMNPFAGFLFLQGLETLSLRAERHSENALALAQYLSTHPRVSWVAYLGLPSHPSHTVANRLFNKRSKSKTVYYGGMVSFGIKDGQTNPALGSKVVDSLKLSSHLANVGDAKTLVIHPASTTHSQLSEDDQKKSGVTPDLIRISVGLEHIDDIIADFEAGLKAAEA